MKIIIIKINNWKFYQHNKNLIKEREEEEEENQKRNNINN